MSTPEDFNKLEQMLSDLPVRKPSQMLDERIAATLSGTLDTAAHSHGARHMALVWGAAAAILVATSVVAIVLVALNQAPPNTDSIVENNPEERLAITPDVNPTPSIKPVNLVWSRDATDQIRYTPSGKPYRAVVRQTIDQRVWIDPDTGATIQTTTPLEALYIVEQPVY